jgi:uncharacterized SAM-binding protein YcdF (DUF218 family)
MDQSDVDKLAQIVWNYHLLHHPLEKADCIFALGSNDTRVADRAIDLFIQGYAPYIIFSGGVGILTKDIFNKPEAEIFADIAMKKGVPREKILIENKSTNTGENVEFTKRLLTEHGLDFNSFILVQKPYMERRTYATFMKVWPGKKFIVTSPQIAFKDYPNDIITKEMAINIMVGDLQRIKIYPEKGYQIYQEIPDKVWSAGQKLIELGYTKHLIKE